MFVVQRVYSATSPVGFVPEFNCHGVNFCQQTNPNIPWKFLLDGCQNIEMFGYTFIILFQTKIVFNREITRLAKFVFVR